MKRTLTSATLAIAMVAAAGSLDAQTPMPRFELGVYGGGALSSPWYEFNNENYSIGAAPIFGTNATFWTNPNFGIRLHGAYMPSRYPTNNNRPIAPGNFPVNNYFADLDLVLRPWMTADAAGFLASTYLWLGGGVLVTNQAGNPTPPGNLRYVCHPAYGAQGVCFSYQPGYATVGQATAGVGFDLFTLGGALGVFGEIGAHGYSPPLHVTNEAVANDPFAVTGRANLGVKVGFGDIAPVVAPVPVPPAPAPPPPAPAPPATREITVCVIEDGQLRTVTATFNPATNDTLVAGQAFAQRYPATAPTYAAGANWFVQQQPVTFENREYVPFGVARVIQPPQLQRAGEFQGTAVFTETGAATPAQVIYVPVRPGCEFQPYQIREALRPRG